MNTVFQDVYKAFGGFFHILSVFALLYPVKSFKINYS